MNDGVLFFILFLFLYNICACALPLFLYMTLDYHMNSEERLVVKSTRFVFISKF